MQMRADTGLIVRVDTPRVDLNLAQQSFPRALCQFLFGLGDGLCPIVGSLAAAFILLGLSGLMS
jgi:hypothetical protein